jgi:ABC-type molybdate transport system substrate-binding protein
MGDNSSAPVGDWSQSTFDGLRLLTNAINWAVGNMTNAPTVSAPANQTVPVGQVASFSVTASGPGPFTYQWRKISGGTTNNINGAVYADYTTPATVAGDNGAGFQVVATGLYGSVTSSVATLTVQVGSPGFVGSPVFSNGQLTLTWTNGSTLLSSTNLTLPMANWTVVVGASSPYTVPATNSQMFYRIKQ